MPQAYNLTHEGIVDKIIDILESEEPGVNWKLLGQNSLIKSLA